MKRLSITAYILLFVFLFSACVQTGSKEQQTYSSSGDRLTVVCTVFPVYDWIYEIIGEENERFTVRFLGEKKDTHSYQPSIQDVAAVASCDLLVFVGGESDKWVEKTVNEHNISAIRLFDVSESTLLREEHLHGGIAEAEYDEHIWLSLRMAERSVRAISDELCELDPDGAEEYRKNTEQYCQRLRELDAEYMKAAENSEEKTVIFADRFPFRYMMEDYGIKCIAAFPGCSAEQDADFETIAKLSEAVDRFEKETVLVLENSNQAVADTIIKSTEKRTAKAAVMNSCQSVIEEDADYIEIMQANLKSLKAALE